VVAVGCARWRQSDDGALPATLKEKESLPGRVDVEDGADRASEIERIYRAPYGTFLRVAVAIAGDEPLAEEAVHDGFVRALRHHRRFGGRGSLEGWLWRIIVNEARRRRAAEQRTRLASATDSDDVSAMTNGHREAGVLAALVAALPERQRLALFLRYADLDYAAIADALGVKPGTVAATLHAAHAALRRELLEVER
jgi:RNA polymerase sigma factor (sigma-70 family)